MHRSARGLNAPARVVRVARVGAARDATRTALFTQLVDHVGQFVLAEPLDQLERGIAARRVHAHVERATGTKAHPAIGVRELLIVDRDPWALELYRLEAGTLVSIGTSTIDRPDALVSATLPLVFRLVAGTERPRIEVAKPDASATWTI